MVAKRQRKEDEIAALMEQLRKAKEALVNLQRDEEEAKEQLEKGGQAVASARDGMTAAQEAREAAQAEHEEHKDQLAQADEVCEVKAEIAEKAEEEAQKELISFAPKTREKENSNKALEKAVVATKAKAQQAAVQDIAIDEANILLHFWDEELKVRIAEWEAAKGWWAAEQDRRVHKESMLLLVDLEAKLQKARLLADWVENPAEWRYERHQTEQASRKSDMISLEESVKKEKLNAADLLEAAQKKEVDARGLEEEAIRMRDAMRGTRNRSMSQIEMSKNSISQKVQELYEKAKQAALATRAQQLEDAKEELEQAQRAKREQDERDTAMRESKAAERAAKRKADEDKQREETEARVRRAEERDLARKKKGKDSTPGKKNSRRDDVDAEEQRRMDAWAGTSSTGGEGEQQRTMPTEDEARRQEEKDIREKQMMEQLLKDKAQRKESEAAQQNQADVTVESSSVLESVKLHQASSAWQAQYTLLKKVSYLKKKDRESEAMDLEGRVASEEDGMDMLIWWEVWNALPSNDDTVPDDKVLLIKLKQEFSDAVAREENSLTRMGWNVSGIKVALESVEAPEGAIFGFPEFWRFATVSGK